MTRIATEFFTRQSARDLLRTQSVFVEAQRQIAQQTKADDLQGYGRQAETLVSVEGLRNRAQSFLDLGKDLVNRFEQQDLGLGRAAESADTLQLRLTEALTLDDASLLGSQLQEAFDNARAGFNARYAGNSLFNGAATDTSPVIAQNLSDLVTPTALADINSVFDNADLPQSIRVDETVTINPAPFARDTGRALFSSFQRIEQFLQANPTLGRPLTQAQRDFLSSEIPQLSAAAGGIRAAQAENGIQQNRVESLQESQRASVNLLKGVTSDITRVDLAEVAARLSQAQTQFQAAASVFGRIQELSLVNLLR